MIRHLFKAIPLIKIDCRVLRIDHEANTANLIFDTSHAVNGVEEQVFSDAFPPMRHGHCQSPQTKHGNLVR